MAQLQKEMDKLIQEKETLEKKHVESGQELKDSLDQIKTTLQEDMEKEERLRK